MSDESESIEAAIRGKLEYDLRTAERIERGVYFGKLIWGIVVAVAGMFIAIVGLAYNAGRTSEKLQTSIEANTRYINELRHAEVRNRMKVVEQWAKAKDPAFQRWIPEQETR